MTFGLSPYQLTLLELGQADHAEQLRRQFDVPLPFKLGLVNAISPVIVLDERTGPGTVPFVIGVTIAAAVSGTRAHFALINDREGITLYVDRVVGILGGGEWYQYLASAEFADDAVNDVKTNARPAATIQRGIEFTAEYGRLGTPANHNAALAISPIIFRGTASIVQERTQLVTIGKGEVYYLLAGGTVGADSLTHLWIEGRQVRS